ncbi:MAG: 4-phosphopantetheinyl transferase family protein [Armatimonadetes bacterium]|nr:4-phosphopantetheinyl transferase family protein [Armatimonadota bacterium]
MIYVGNDVVDTDQAAQPGDRGWDRFIGRVLAADERRLVRERSDITVLPWMLWAAKESAFKIMRKRDPSAIFAHPGFHVDCDDLTSRLPDRLFPGGTLPGAIRHAGQRFSLRWDIGMGYVHCLAWHPGGGHPDLASVVEETDDAVGIVLDPREAASVHSPASARVRHLARRLVHQRYGLEDACIVRERGNDGRFGPPRVMAQGGAVPDLDLSLSHDGRFVAVACASSLESH